MVGPLADKKGELFGTWCGIDTAKSASVVQAVKEMVGNKARVIFAKGCNLTNEPMLAKASGLKVDPVGLAAVRLLVCRRARKSC